MIRRYRPDPLPQDAVERIIAAALHGPSAGFSQGIDVTAVLQPEMRRRVVVEALNNEPDSPLLDAPLLLIITADEERYHRRYNEPDKLAVGGGQEIGWPVPYWYVDAGSAMMLALLAAVDEGLSAGFYGHPDHVARLQRVLEMPSNAVPIGVIAIGYSAEESLSPAARQHFRTRRRPESETVHRERW
jgi:nitroreductase